jgi:hypothetical protein
MNRAWLLVVLALCATSCGGRSREADALETSVVPTDFRLLKSGIRFAGENHFALAAQEGYYPPSSPFPDNPMFPPITAGGRVWHPTNGAGLIARDPVAKTYSIYNSPGGFALGNHVRAVFGDEEFLFIALGDFATQGRYGPSFLVLSLRDGRLGRLSKVPSRGGTFGSSGTPEARAAMTKNNSTGPQIGWDYRRLKDQPVVDLTKDWFLQNPTSIRRDGGFYVLSYFESWQIEAVVVRLRVPIASLRAAVQQMDAPAPGAPPVKP